MAARHAERGYIVPSDPAAPPTGSPSRCWLRAGDRSEHVLREHGGVTPLADRRPDAALTGAAGRRSLPS